MGRYEASLVVALSKDILPSVLHKHIIKICSAAISARGVFTIALSGGSLPSFLSKLHESFVSLGVDPKYNCWHVILADERCVPNDHPENNLNAIRANFLAKVSIPEHQVYGIDESQLNEPTEAIAYAYEEDVRSVVSLSGGYLDLAVLGFGPDGTTTTVFTSHFR
jgi:6-phosphogluconolactonase